MGVKVIKPTSNSRRNTIMPDFSDITKDKPEKALLTNIRQRAGRNNKGRLTVRHRGSGEKRQYRIIDFARDHKNPGLVVAIEYDPNRTARIALVQYGDGQKRYVIAHDGVQVGQAIVSGETPDMIAGNASPIGHVPIGTYIHNIELIPGKGGKLVRSAGAVAQVMAHEAGYTLVRMPSGEMRRFLDGCKTTIGQVGNLDHKNTRMGKAGRARHKGLRPEVRGAVMSPRDHPHGGGEGKNSAGLKHRKTKWGKPALGPRTRNNKRTDKYILRRRYQK
jgi:large subunit ribosomal protein L2